MVDFRAFVGWRPPVEETPNVADVPYDVVSTTEARTRVEDRPHSILRVTRPDIDLPDGSSLYGEAAYAQAQSAFSNLIERGMLNEDSKAGYYVYAQQMGDHRQVGIVGLASADDYWNDRIKKHEFTRPQKEDDRLRHIEAVGAHLGPIFLAYRAHNQIELTVESIVAQPAEVDFVADDGVLHQLWPIYEEAIVDKIAKWFGEVPALYIADGHHRAAAASRIGRGAAPNDPRGLFLAVAFPDSQLKILPYNRVVLDLNGLQPEQIIEAISVHFEVSEISGPEWPSQPREFTMCLLGQWYSLRTLDPIEPAIDPVGALDVSLLQTRILDPIFGIKDPRTDNRIEFVGGIRGLDFLASRASQSNGVAFALFATSLDELMSIADSGEVMPPKSTWFEPKLRTGVVISRYRP